MKAKILFQLRGTQRMLLISLLATGNILIYLAKCKNSYNWNFGYNQIFYQRFQLKNKQNIPGCGINAVKGCTFFVDKIDPIKFEVADGPDLQSGKRYTLILDYDYMITLINIKIASFVEKILFIS